MPFMELCEAHWLAASANEIHVIMQKYTVSASIHTPCDIVGIWRTVLRNNHIQELKYLSRNIQLVSCYRRFLRKFKMWRKKIGAYLSVVIGRKFRQVRTSFYYMFAKLGKSSHARHWPSKIAERRLRKCPVIMYKIHRDGVFSSPFLESSESHHAKSSSEILGIRFRSLYIFCHF